MRKRIVRIEWIDSNATGNYWESREDVGPLKVAVCQSVGFITEENDEYVTLVQSQSQEQFCGRITIPRVCITNTVNLQVENWGER